jgi:hypothetical protein
MYRANMARILTSETRADWPNIYTVIHYSTALCWALDDILSFLILYRVVWTPWMGDQPVARPLPTHRTRET